jgi:hypothetical protein
VSSAVFTLKKIEKIKLLKTFYFSEFRKKRRKGRKKKAKQRKMFSPNYVIVIAFYSLLIFKVPSD